MAHKPVRRIAAILPAIFSLCILLIPKSNLFAACKLVITSAYTCDSAGTAYKPQVGDTYFVRVNWTVSGTPNSAYTVRFKEANITWDWTDVSTPNPGSYWGYVGWNLPYDGKVPFSITLDPNNVSGNTNEAHNTFSSTFLPIPPATSIEYYDTKQLAGSETFTVNWVPGSGLLTTGDTLLGVPATGTFQTVVSNDGPTGSSLIKSKPTGDPVWESRYSNYEPVIGNSSWVVTSNFVVNVSSVRVNPSKLGKVNWSDFARLPKSVKPYLIPDHLVQSTDPHIDSFVQSVLPQDYKTTMSPYAAARTLFLAVVTRTTYEDNQADVSAVATLDGRIGNCAGFSDLYAACLLAVGIPARMDCGWWSGIDQWHCFNEFYLPKVGWIPADTSADRLWGDPTGNYAEIFGFDPYLNNICIVSRATTHAVPHLKADEMQLGWINYHGDAILDSYSDSCSLN